LDGPELPLGEAQALKLTFVRYDNIEVVEVDEKTETTRVTVEGESIDIERLRDMIAEMGASLHSVDEVEVRGSSSRGD